MKLTHSLAVFGGKRSQLLRSGPERVPHGLIQETAEGTCTNGIKEEEKGLTSNTDRGRERLKGREEYRGKVNKGKK